MRIYLAENEGIDGASPKGTLKAAFRQGLILENEELGFSQMLDDRNRSSHVYDELEAAEIFGRVKAGHLELIKNLLARLDVKH